MTRSTPRTGHPTTILLLAAAALLGCAEPAQEETPGAEGEVTAEQGEVRLVRGARSEAAYPAADVQIEHPLPGAVVRDSAVDVRLRVEGFELAVPTTGVETRGLAVSEQGQHLHVVLDERPYEAIYDVDQPVRLGDLEPGAHLLVVFPSRQWHESVKSAEAAAVSYFFARDTTDGLLWEPEEPFLTYSRPKSTDEGADADSILVDFYLHNTDLRDEHWVRLTVDDTVTFPIREWAPHYLLGLSEGQHQIRLDLLGPGGRPVITSETNATERDISVLP